MDASADGPVVAVGLMLPGLPLLALGLPWSAAFFDADDPLTKGTWLVLALGPAVLNVVIHGLIRLVLVATRRVDAGTRRHGHFQRAVTHDVHHPPARYAQGEQDRDAAVPQSCSRIAGSPAAAHWSWTSRVQLRGSSGVPIGVVKT